MLLDRNLIIRISVLETLILSFKMVNVEYLKVLYLLAAQKGGGGGGG